MKDGERKGVGLSVGWSRSSGISLHVISRYTDAYDQWKADEVAIKGLEKRREVALGNALIAAEVARIDAASKAVSEHVAADLEAARLLLNRQGRIWQREQSNVDSVLAKAGEILSIDQRPSDDTERMVDPDWLGYVHERAKVASTERMRDLIARILAGEIRQPGTFSLRTIRAVAEIGKPVMEAFAKHTLRRAGWVFFPTHHPQLSDQTRGELDELSEHGLIQHDATNMFSGSPVLYDTTAKTTISVAVGEATLEIISETGSIILPDAMHLTNVGKQLAELLDCDVLATAQMIVDVATTHERPGQRSQGFKPTPIREGQLTFPGRAPVVIRSKKAES